MQKRNNYEINRIYQDVLSQILARSFEYEDPNRKEVFRKQIPHYNFVYDFNNGFPAITTKKLYWKGVVAELLWFLRGNTNIKYLVDNGINIWNKDAYNYYLKNNKIDLSKFKPDNKFKKHYDYWLWSLKQDKSDLGDLGRVYGAQWRDWAGITNNIDVQWIDQISNLIKGLKENPMGTRHIVTAWNPAELDNMALPPCHWSFEILVEPLNLKERTIEWIGSYTEPMVYQTLINILDKKNIPKYKFTLKWHQRSVDTFLGLPFNIASYALLAHIIGKLTNMKPKALIGDLSNVHIYKSHLEATKKLLSRDISKYKAPDLEFTPLALAAFEHSKDFNDFLSKVDIDNFKLKNYNSYPTIKAEMLSYNK